MTSMISRYRFHCRFVGPAHLERLVARLGKVIASLAFLVLASGCASQIPLTDWANPLPESTPVYPAVVTTGDVLEVLFYPGSTVQESAYLLAVGDIVRVEIDGHPNLDRDRVIVLPDGTISLPLIGALAIAGQSTEQAGALIKRRYLQRKLNDPTVVVSVVEAQQRLKRLLEPSRLRSETGALVFPVFQNTPISLPFIAPVQVDRSIAEIREEISVRYAKEFGSQLSVVVNFRQRDEPNILVMGEVKLPGKIVMKQPLTPLSAIASAGGYTDSGDPKRVAVIRLSPQGVYQKWLFDLNRDLNEPQSPYQGFTLVKNDVVLVVKTGVADTNLWIAQYIRNNIPFTYLGTAININP